MSSSPGSGATADPRPNLILIVTDDQAVREQAQMPRVNQLLGHEGITFANFLVADPVCAPSRASILRGQYVHNHGVLRNTGPNGGYQAFRRLERSTIATWLQAAGYRTALIGKYLNGYGRDPQRARVPRGWNEWHASLRRDYFDYDMIENGRVVHYDSRPRDYLTDVESDKARAFVRQSVAAGRPFFLYLTPHAPHGPATPAPRDQHLFAHIDAPQPPSFNEADVSDKPAYVRSTSRLGGREIQTLNELYRNRLRSLQAVDKLVADLVATLQETASLDQTYLFFTSDNGFLLGEHRRTEKGMPYEEAIRTPLLARGPGVAAGTVASRVASNIDLAPTLAELAGVTPPTYVDGRSLVPLLQGAAASWRQAVLVEHGGGTDGDEESTVGASEPRSPAFAALRQAAEVYVEYETGERELYDLGADPFELANQANDPARAAEIATLHAWLQALQGCAGARCRDADSAPP